MGILEITSVGLYKCNMLLKKKGSVFERTSEAYEIELYDNDYKISINNFEYSVGRGSVVLTKPNDYRVNNTFYSCDAIHFTTDEPSIIEFIDKMPTIINVYDYNFHIGFFKEVYRHYVSIDKAYVDFYLASDVMRYLCFLKNESNELNSIKGNISPSLYDCIDYIKKNYSEKISLEDIANSARISVSYMHRLFKNVFIKTPLEYVTEVRIQKAKYLLISTKLRIADIADKTGFESPTNFHITFKAKTGISPGKYRKITPHDI